MTTLPAKKTLRIASAASAVLALSLLTGCGSDSAGDSASSAAAAASDAASSTPSALSSKATGAEGSPVAAADLAAFVSDRTFTGTADGSEYQEYYAADGSINGVQDGEKYTGSWQVQDEKLCVTYDDTASAQASLPADAMPSVSSSQACYTINASGSNAYWYSDGDVVETTTFVQGNPGNL